MPADNVSATGPSAGFTGSDIDRSAHYGTIGYGLGRFLPRITYAEVKGKNTPPCL